MLYNMVYGSASYLTQPCQNIKRPKRNLSTENLLWLHPGNRSIVAPQVSINNTQISDTFRTSPYRFLIRSDMVIGYAHVDSPKLTAY